MTDRPAPRPAGRTFHSHLWIFGVVGVLAGAALMVFAPGLPGVSRSLLLFAGFHLVGAFVLAGSLYLTWLRRLFARAAGKGAKLSFGPAGWLDGMVIAAVICFAVAVAVQVAEPGLWPLAFALLILGALFLAGHQVARGHRAAGFAPLPMVDLLPSGLGAVLDVGCGAGRATIALGQALPRAHIVALDRFGPGETEALARLERNLGIARMEDRVSIQAGELAPLPFADTSFDAVVAALVYDHRGGERTRALGEVHRVLKPGGRLLMTARTPGWAMFAALNLLSLLLTPPRRWRAIAAGAGLRPLAEGRINNAWYLLLERPASAD